MRTVILTAALFIGTMVSAQSILGVKLDKENVNGYTMYTCGCFCSKESVVDEGDIVYYLTFHIDEYPDMSIKYMEKVFDKFLEVLKANGHDVEDPDRIQVTDYSDYPILSDIKRKLAIGYLPEERFDYVIGDYVVSLIYSSTEYQLFIYKNNI